MKFILPVLLLFIFSCNNEEKNVETPATDGIPEALNIPYTVLNAYPHDTSAFTQGLEFYKGTLYESTGLATRSTLRTVDYKTGRILSQKKLSDSLFGEGITILRDTLYQLTYQNHAVLVYNPKDFSLIKRLSWTSEGWGITNDGTKLYLSDGSDKIYIVRPSDFKLLQVIGVRDQYGPVNNINELEFINGYIYANRWGMEYILKIDPQSGIVKGRINLDNILQKNSKADLTYLSKPGTVADSGAVLNGIAYDSTTGKLYVTGKLWPNLFEIQLTQ
jgi:glutamine cyclotransferase